MIKLVFSFFREKLRFILSCFIFTFVLLFFLFTISSYNEVEEEIEELKGKITNTEWTINIMDSSLKPFIENLEHVTIKETHDAGFIISYKISIEEKYVKEVLAKLDKDEFNVQNSNEDILSEIESEESAQQFYRSFIFAVFVFTIGIFYIETRLLLAWDNKNIIFLHILGYPNYLIGILMELKLLFSSTVSAIFACLIFATFDHVIYPWQYFLPLIVSISIIIIQYPLLMRRIKKLQLTNLFD